MPITSLRAQLQAQATDAPILISERGAWRLPQLTAALQTAALHEARKNPAVALRLDDPAKLALALIALDGEIDRMLLLPGGLADQDADALVAQFGATALLTDRAQTSASAWGHIDWSGAIETGTESSPVVQNRKTQWVLSTSGTTGTPKLVAHSLASLTRTTKAQSKSPLHWGQLYDIARFAGTQVFLQGILGGVLVLPRGDWSLPQRISFLAENGCAALSATPTLWRKILMTPGHENLALSQVTLGGEIADAAILRAVANKFPAARVTHIFASTEAGAAFSVRDGLPGFPARYLSEPPGGVALKVVGDRLFVQTHPERAEYLNSVTSFATPDGFVDTGDMVEIRGDRCMFLGRANGSINVGGNKLYPEEVEWVLLDHPQVDLARVYAKQSPITGQLVVAEIVPAGVVNDAAALRRTLQDHCASHLEKWKAPAIIRLVDQLQASASGKLSRSGA